jgi:D-alanyl-D-alanine carboxypeptidase
MELAARLQALVQSQIDTAGADPIHSAALLVETPDFLWSGAAGLADGVREPMTPRHKFKIASITKAFTATVVLQLVEEGRVRLSDSLGGLFTAADLNLDSLHVHQGIAYGRGIRIEHLLHHTSGIRDYMEDPRFIPDVLANPDRQWSPHAVLATYFAYGTHRQAHFPPGEDWAYADPNYVLLGLVIEKVTGSALHEVFRQRIFEPLGMANTYLEFYEEPRGMAPLSHAYFSDVDLHGDINTSFDWGGGGLVSTVDELNTFFRALLRGEMFTRDETLTPMLAAADRGLGGEEYDYGLGIMKREICGLTFYGHGGAYDCDCFYCPAEDVSVCMTLNQMLTHGKRDEFVRQAVVLVMTRG